MNYTDPDIIVDHDAPSVDEGPEPILPGTRLEIGKPVQIAEGQWLCVAKLLGGANDLPWIGTGTRPVPGPDEVTRTVFVAQGRGDTPELAEQDAVHNLATACRPPKPVVRGCSEPPPPAPVPSFAANRAGIRSPVPPTPIVVGIPDSATARRGGVVAWFKRLLGLEP